MKKRTSAATGDEFDPRVPLTLERVIVGHDYNALSSMLKEVPETLRKGLDELETMIADNRGAADSLNKLCGSICDRRASLWLLHPFSRPRVFAGALWSTTPGPGSIESLLGLDSEELHSLTKKMYEVANQLGSVNGQAEFSALLMLSHDLHPVYRLPQTLRTGARVMQYAAKHFAGNTHIYDNVAKARLTSFVLAKIESSYAGPRRTMRREYRDEDVANLISAVSGDKHASYDSVAHRTWRRKHYHRLSALDPEVDQKLPSLISALL